MKPCLLIFIASSFAAQASPVAISNSSFESNLNPDATGRFSFGETQDFGGSLTDWTTVTTENTPAPNGAEISVGFIAIAPANGSQVLALMAGASVKQFTSVAWSSLTAGDTITMTVAVGDRTNTPAPVWADESFFAIIDGVTSGTLADGSLLSSTVAGSGPLATPFASGGVDGGTMQDRSFSYTVLASDLSRSGNVGVLLAAYGVGGSTGNGLNSSNNQAFFDHVRIDVQAAPVGAPAPNIVFLFLDDMRWDAAGFAGNAVVTTPNMDTLAAQGTIFENAFTTTAICMVSRAGVFMGQHMARHGITAFNQNLNNTKWADSYPKKLDDAGFYMGFIGKHGLGDGFTGLYGTYDFNKGWDGQGTYFNQTIDGEPANGRHTTKFVGDLAVQFIGDAVNPAKNTAAAPFCLQISWKAPHVQDPNSFIPDPVYDLLYQGDTIPHAKTDTQAQFNGNLSIFQSGEGTSRWNARFGTEALFQENVKKHHRLVHGVDVQIGRILAALNDPNNDGNTSDSLTANTIIILGSDHGFFLGERRQAGKWYIHEESIRVPLVVMDPRLPAAQKGKRVSQMALNLDIPATILDYAGVAKPIVMQGRSLKPVIEGSPPGDWRSAFLHDHPAVGSGVYRNEGVRTESFSYSRYPSNGSVMQLYDVTVDPYQRTNLADDPRYASKLAEMDSLTTQLKADAQ